MFVISNIQEKTFSKSENCIISFQNSVVDKINFNLLIYITILHAIQFTILFFIQIKDNFIQKLGQFFSVAKNIIRLLRWKIGYYVRISNYYLKIFNKGGYCYVIKFIKLNFVKNTIFWVFGKTLGQKFIYFAKKMIFYCCKI